MGNQICCEQTHSQPQFQVTVVHKKQAIKVPELAQPVSKTLHKQRPFQKLFVQNPILKEVGDDIFQGKTDQRGRPIGYGKLYYKNKSLFLGKFQFGIANGPGFYIDSDGSYYSGIVVDNKAEDDNGYYWSQSYQYKGGVRNNKPHGKGKQWGQKHDFEGQYIDGKKYNGTLKWRDVNNGQCIYTGQFNDDGLFHGDGELKQKIGTYKGQFKDGKKDGKGVFLYESNLRYEGEYKNNKKQGVGKVINKDDTISYEGQFKDGLPHGKGTAPSKQGRNERQWVYGIDAVFIENIKE